MYRFTWVFWVAVAVVIITLCLLWRGMLLGSFADVSCRVVCLLSVVSIGAITGARRFLRVCGDDASAKRRVISSLSAFWRGGVLGGLAVGTSLYVWSLYIWPHATGLDDDEGWQLIVVAMVIGAIICGIIASIFGTGLGQRTIADAQPITRTQSESDS